MLSIVLTSTLAPNVAHFLLFHLPVLIFSSFPSSWKTLNVTVYVHTGIHAFVGSGMHHYCTFVTVVSCPGVNGSLLCCFSMIFFHLEKVMDGWSMMEIASRSGVVENVGVAIIFTAISHSSPEIIDME